jgi:hypothetical protein
MLAEENGGRFIEIAFGDISWQNETENESPAVTLPLEREVTERSIELGRSEELIAVQYSDRAALWVTQRKVFRGSTAE